MEKPKKHLWKSNPQRGIDEVLRSIPKLAKALTITCLTALILLGAIGYIAEGFQGIASWILSFINPGSTYSESTFIQCFSLLVGVLGMILGGALISVITNIMQRRMDDINNGMVYYPFSNHVLIIGFDRMSVSIIRQVAKKYPEAEIVLQTVQNIPAVRHELLAHLPSSTEQRVTIVSGARNINESLEKLCAENCAEIFLLGENNEYDHDSVNIECLKMLAQIRRNKSEGAVKCHVLFEYQSTYAVFQQQDIPNLKDTIDFIPFNFYESWAQKVFTGKEYSFCNTGIAADSNKHVHLVVFGMSRMGIAIGIQAAHLCHFPNFVTKEIKTRITFVDEHADREMNFLRTRYRHLFEEIDWFYENSLTGERQDNTKTKKKFTDIEFEFIKGRIEYAEIQNKIVTWATTPDSLLTIAICFNLSPVAIAAGLYLPDEVYTNHIPVFLRQETSSTTISLLSQSYKYKNVKPFGILDDAYDLEKAEDLMPMMVKHVYDQTSKNYGKDIVFEKDKEGEKTFLLTFDRQTLIDGWNIWKDDEGNDSKNIIALKFSNIHNANMLKLKQNSLNIKHGNALNEEQINLLARIEHNRWNIEKLLMGYRACTHEEAESIENKTRTKKDLRDQFIHKDIKPYKELTKDDKGIQADQYDINISKALPYMLSEYKKLNKNTDENEQE